MRKKGCILLVFIFELVNVAVLKLTLKKVKLVIKLLSKIFILLKSLALYMTDEHKINFFCYWLKIYIKKFLFYKVSIKKYY